MAPQSVGFAILERTLNPVLDAWRSRAIGIRLVMLVLAFAVAFPHGLFAPNGVASTAGVSGQIPAATTAPDWDALPRVEARDRRSGKDGRNRPHQRKGKTPAASGKQEPPAPPPPPDRPHVRTLTDPGPSKRERKRRWESKCDAPGSVLLPEIGGCTHGGDPAPPGFDIARRVEPVAPRRARAASVLCEGDGQSGARVQVLYVRAADVPDHYERYLASFRDWAGDADGIMRQSAADAGGGRRIRFVTTEPGCQIEVTPVVLSAKGDDSFSETVTQLRARGFDREDRIYLAFVDTTAAGICGMGTLWHDDSSAQSNWNNVGPSYSRVDAGCWSGFTAAHELMHNLGGVQTSAPNSNGSAHCIDDYDVMCYRDSQSAPAPVVVCASEAKEHQFDCGHDDYFHPSPPAGSYLARHWNTANSRFLIGSEASAPDSAPPAVDWVSPVATGKTYDAAAGEIALEVAASDDQEVRRVEFWRYDEGQKRYEQLGVARDAPYTLTIDAADLWPRYTYLYAEAYDGAWNRASAHIWVWKESSETPPDAEPDPLPVLPSVAITTPTNNAMLKAGTTIDVEIVNSTSAAIEVRSCQGSPCSWRTATTVGTDDSAPYAIAWPVPAPGTYTLVARAADVDQTLSEPVTVTIEKAQARDKDKKSKKKGKKKRKRR